MHIPTPKLADLFSIFMSDQWMYYVFLLFLDLFPFAFLSHSIHETYDNSYVFPA